MDKLELEGDVRRGNCHPDIIFLENDMLIDLILPFIDKKVKLTIEVIEEPEPQVETIVRTYRELEQRYNWLKVCETLGCNYFMFNEGQADNDTTVTITMEQAKEIGIY